MNHKPHIAVCLICSDTGQNIAYCINSLMAQNYRNAELLIMFDTENNALIDDVITIVNMHPSNFLKVTMYKVNSNLDYSNIIRILQRNLPKGYVTFLSINDAYYDNNVLSNFSLGCINVGEEPHAIMLQTAVHNLRDDSWISFPSHINISNLCSLDKIKQKKELSVNNNLISSSICFSTDVLNLLYGKDVLEICINSLQKLAKRNLKIYLSVGLYGIRHECDVDILPDSLIKTLKQKENISTNLLRKKRSEASRKRIAEVNALSDKLLMNLSNYNRFATLVEICLNSLQKTSGFLKNKNEHIIAKIEEEYRYIIANFDGFWGITDSNALYLYYLEVLKQQILSHNFCESEVKSLLKKVKQQSKDKYSVVFFANEYSVWPSLKSVYDTAMTDSRFAVDLVYVPFYHERSQAEIQREIKTYYEHGYKPQKHRDYNITEESPDIVVYVKPYNEAIPEELRIREIGMTTRYCIYIPYGMEIGNNKKCLQYQCYGSMQFIAWKVLAFCKDYYNRMSRHTYSEGKNYLPIGHPRVDLRLAEYSDNLLYKSIKGKAANRTIVLWNTHFTLGDGFNDLGTYQIYGDDILDYFNKHNELFLLWRPHPLFYKSLAQNKNVTLESIINVFDTLQMKENIYIDQHSDYLPSLAASDVMISDFASFVPEYLVRNKRLIVTQRPNIKNYPMERFKNYIEIATRKEDIINFLDDVRRGKTSSKVPWKLICDEFYIDENETVAKKLLNYIDKEIMQKASMELAEFASDNNSVTLIDKITRFISFKK